MKKFILVFILFITVSCLYAQSTITIGSGSSIGVGATSSLEAGYRDGTMKEAGNFNSRTITFDPVAIAATPITQTSFTANWNASTGANGYRLDVSTTSNFSSFLSGYQNLDVGTVTSYSVSLLSPGTTYYYRVRAYDVDGITGYSNTVAVITVLADPVAVAATNITDISFSANWGGVASATGYYIDVATTSNFTEGTFVLGYQNKSVGNVTTYTISGLTGNKTYYYRVRAFNASGTSSSSNTISVLTAPAGPVLNAATPIGQTSFTINWSASEGATKYYLDVSTIANFSTFVTDYQNRDIGNTTGFSVSSVNILAGTKYYYRLRASNGTNTSTNSLKDSIITIPPNPTVANASNILSTSFSANWSASTGASGYRLYVANNPLFRPSDAVTDYWDVDVDNVFTYSVNTNLSAGTTYYYKVRAYNSSGTSDSSVVKSVITTPPAPVALAANPVYQSSFTANWNATAGAEKYFLDVSQDQFFGSYLLDYRNKEISETSYSVTGLLPGIEYYYRVRAFNSGGTSQNSDTVLVTTAPAEPVLLAATNVNESSFYANWNPSTTATGYKLDVSLVSDFSTKLDNYNDKEVNDVNTYLVSGLSSNTIYYYRVRAYNSGGTSSNTTYTELLTSPPVPLSAAVGTITQTSFDANWNSSASAIGYLLDVSTDINFGATTFVTGYNNKDVGSTTCSVTGLTAGTKYYYRVRAYNSGGTSSNPVGTLVTTVPPEPVIKPASDITSTGFTANWNSSPEATEYFLYVATSSSVDGNGDFTSPVGAYNGVSVAGTSQSLTLSAGTTYYYKVKAKNTSGTSGYSGIVTALTQTAKPVLSDTNPIHEIDFTINWSSITSASGYLLDVSTSGDCLSNYVDGYHDFDVGNVTSFNVTGLSGGTTYYYRLRSYNSGGNSAYSDIKNTKTLSPVPVALAASTVSATSFTAKWIASTGVDSYSLYVAEDNLFSIPVTNYNPKSVTGTSEAIATALTSGKQYYYKLVAVNASGSSAASNIISVVTLPPAPTNLASGSITTNSFVASWNSSDGATGYLLSVSKSDFNQADAVSGFWEKNVGTATSFAVTGLEAGTTYYFQVKAYNNSGTGANTASVNVTTSAITLDAPVAKPASSIDSTSFTANWNSVSGATGYKIDISTDSGFGSYIEEDISVAGTSHTINAGLTAGGTYYYRVRSTDGTTPSNNSNIITVEVMPQAPVTVAGDTPTETSFVAHWNTSAGADGYYLDVSKNSDFSAGNFISGFENRDVGPVDNYTITGLSAETNYYYRLRAYNSGGTSRNSVYKVGTTDASTLFIATAATSITTTSFTANWNTFPGADHYLFYVSTSSACDGSFLASYNGLNVGSVLSKEVTLLNTGTNYYYKVVAYDASNAILTDGTSNIINVITLPAVPALAAVTNILENTFDANWSFSTGANGYYLDVSSDNSFGTFLSGLENKYVGNINTYKVDGLLSGTNYYYRLRAKNESGTNIGNSSTQTVATLSRKPIAAVATNVTNNSFTANWSATNGDATTYQIDVSTDSDCDPSLIKDNENVGSSSPFNVTGLSGGTIYYYRIYAYNGTSLSDASEIAPVLTKPDKPINLTGSSVAATSFTANWNPSIGATKYYLDVATDAGFTGFYVSGYQNFDVGTNTSYYVTGLSKGTNYFFRVRSFNTSGLSDNSDNATVTTIPAEPVVTSAGNITNTSFTANWNVSAGATEYYVDLSTSSDLSSPTTSAAISNPTHSYSVSGLTEKTYYYRVKAKNATDYSGYSGTMSVLLAPEKPTANTATSITTSSFIASWSSVSGADGYKIDVYTNSGSIEYVSGYNNKDVGSATSTTITGLSSGTTYYYVVRSYVAGRISPDSDPITVLTKPVAPTIAAASNINESGFTANWSEVLNTNYILDVATNNSFTSYFSDYNNKDVGTDENNSITGLSSNTNYYYRVRSNNVSGASDYSGIINVLTAPTVPASVTTSSFTNSSFTATWSASAGAVKYFIDVSTKSGVDFAANIIANYNDRNIGNATSYTVTDLNGGTDYYYRLRACNSNGTNSGSSSIVSVTTKSDAFARPVPSTTAVTANSFTIGWSAVAGVSGYRLDVSTNSNFTSYISGYYNLYIPNTETAYTVNTNISSGATYYYRMRSYDASTSSSSSSPIQVLTKPTSPSLSSATSITETGFTANWNSVVSATKYYLDVSSNDSFTALVVTNQEVTTGTSYPITAIEGGKTYYYRVRAYNASGESANSTSASVLTVPSAPTANDATNPLETSFTANWTKSTGTTTNHFLDVATDNAFSNILANYSNKDVSSEVTNSLVVSGLSGGTTYYYRLRSSNANGTSANSNIKTALTVSTKPVAKNGSSISGVSFTANWKPTKGAEKYLLDVASSNTFAADKFLTGYPNKDVSTDTTFTITGLSESTNYYYRVRANNSGGTSVYSDIVTVLTGPIAPVALDAVNSGETGFIAKWKKSTGIIGYRLDVATDVNFTAGTFATGYVDSVGNVSTYENANVGSDTTYQVLGITSGVTHYYRLRASNSGGPSVNSNTIKVLGVPNALQPTSITLTGFTANWGSVGGINGYKIDISTSSDFSTGTFLTGYENKDVGNVGTLSLSGLTPNTTYYYRVRSYDATSTSGNSNVIGVRNVPAAPVTIAADSIRTSSFRAKWNASVGGASGYFLDVATDAAFTNFVSGYQNKNVSNVLVYKVENLSSAATYYYRVRAQNSMGTSDNSATITVITIPTKPIAKNPSNISQIGFTASWNAVSGIVSGYKIDIASNGDFTNILTGYSNLDVGNVLSFSTTDTLGSGGTYYYRIRAYNASGESENSNVISVLTVPGEPKATAATSITTTSFQANWDDANGASKYYLYVAKDQEFQNFVPGFNGKEVDNITRCSVAGLVSNSTYYYKVSAANTTGYSNYSNVISVITSSTSPVALPASSITQTSFIANWSSAKGNNGYYLDVASDPSFSTLVSGYQNLNVGNDTTYLVNNGILIGTKYYYRIRSYNTGGSSVNSNVVALITIPENPVAMEATIIGKKSFQSNWKKVKNTSGYKVDVAYDSEFANFVDGYNGKEVGDTSSLMIQNVLKDKNYYYRIRSFNSSGVSGYSNIISVKTLANTAPVITNLESSAIEYIVKGGEIGITSSLKISDNDDAYIESATISFSSNFQVGEDWLSLTSQDGISYNWNEKTGVLSLEGKAELSKYENAIKNIQYTNTFLNTTKTDRTIIITVNDGIDNSNSLSRVINIKKTNDAPVLSGMETDSIKFVKGSNTIPISQNIQVEDADNLYLYEAQIKIGNNYLAGEDLLECASSTNIQCKFMESTGTLALNGKAAKTEYETVLKSVKYSNTKGIKATSTKKNITFVVSDGLINSSTVQRNVEIISPVKAPSNLDISVNSSDNLFLSWKDNSDNESGFIIERTEISGNNTFLDTVGVNVNSYIDSKMAEGQYYLYKVFSFMNNGAVCDLNSDNQKTALAPLKAPGELKAISDSKKCIELSWIDNSSIETNYIIERSETDSLHFISLVELGADSCSYNDSSIVNNTKYYYRIYAAKDSLVSAFSNSVEITGVVTGILEELGGIPTEYVLYQNYPNPFNATTTIRYGLPTESSVKISVFNILGEEVKTFNIGVQRPGYYQIHYNTANLSSGIYIYRINADKFNAVKKMIMIK